MNEQDLRDCFAMFAMCGLLMRGNNKLEQIASGAYALADEMLEARNKVEDDGGIATIKKRKYVRKD
jgi:hypothetical protein